MNKKIIGALIAVAVVATAVFAAGCVGPTEGEQVTVMMPFIASPAWAPFYCAIDQGYYADEGLDVTITYSGTGSMGPIQQVGANKIRFGHADANSIIMSRAKDVPVVAVYQIEQTNAFNVITKEDSGISKPVDLMGKQIGVAAIGTPPYLLTKVILFKAGLDYENATFVPVGSGAEITALLQNNVDAIGAHMFHKYLLDSMGKGEDITVMWAKDYGANLAGLTVITNDETLKNNPELVRKFVGATNEGLKYAIDNPEDAMDIYVKFNPDAAEKMAFNLGYWNAFVENVVQPDKYPLGMANKEQWTVTQDTLYDMGIIDKKTDINDICTSEFVEEIRAEE